MKYNSISKTHPYDLKELAKIKILCTECQTVYNYNDAVSHKQLCARPNIRCVLDCGSKQTFRSVDELEEHITQDCTLVDFTCDTCEGTETRLTKDNHRCSQNTLIETLTDMKGVKSIFTL